MIQESGIESLVEETRKLREDPYVRGLVEGRIAEFLDVKNKANSAWFIELVYCLLTAYSSAERAQFCVEALEDCGALIDGNIREVAETLRREGHRFADRRAEYIVSVRTVGGKIKQIIQGFQTLGAAREWLVKHVKGLGWKEASHFLRNVGYFDVAILDRHILSNMREYGLISDSRGKGLTKRRYLEYEGLLKKVAYKMDMTLGEMDLYLWYRKTGKVLK